MKIRNLKHLFLIFLSLVIMFSCSYNYKNIELKGVIVDNKTGKPVKDAVVLVTYWVYTTDTWDSKSFKKSIRTTEKGHFNFNFEKAEALDIEVNAKGYHQWIKSITLSNRKIDLKIEMSAL